MRDMIERHMIAPFEGYSFSTRHFDPVEEPAQALVFDVGLEIAARLQLVRLIQVELAPAVWPFEVLHAFWVHDGEKLTPAASFLWAFEAHDESYCFVSSEENEEDRS